MRLTLVVQRYGEGVVGGAERYVERLATGLAADGHDISVVTSCAVSYADFADVPRYRFELGQVLVKADKIDEGLRLITTAMQETHEFDHFYDSLADILDAYGMPDRATEARRPTTSTTENINANGHRPRIF